ncbi:MAG: aldose 1-epimerase, partial [Spirochaetota bacterium]
MDHSSGRGHGCRLLEFTHRNQTFITIENESLRVTILVDKGADIVEFLHKPTDTDFLWREPGGIRDAGKSVPTIASSWGNNLDYYPGGWHESLPGGPCTILGAAEGLHGEATLLPWSWKVEEDDPAIVSIAMTCRLIRLPLVLHKRLRLRTGASTLEIEEALVNESDVEIALMWGHHPTFGKPFLDENCRIDAPAKRFRADPSFTSPLMFVAPGSRGDWPLTHDRNGDAIDLSWVAPGGSGYAGLLCLEVEEGWYAITNTRRKVGFGLRWDVKLFPFLHYWHVYNGVPDYPWFNRVYVAGIEPWTSFPMNQEAAKAAGTTLRIAGKAELRTAL